MNDENVFSINKYGYVGIPYIVYKEYLHNKIDNLLIYIYQNEEEFLTLQEAFKKIHIYTMMTIDYISFMQHINLNIF